MDAERSFARQLLDEFDRNKVVGDIVEFGVAGGGWLGVLADWRESAGSPRRMFGFDSFEGLPDTTSADLDCWSKGMYAYDIETVGKNLKVDSRPWLELHKGWFSDSLRRDAAQQITQIAYARIDCDLHASTLDCLAYLSSRLVDQGLLVFDDWTYDPAKGETRSFLEWLLSLGNNWSFETLLENPLGHVYLRTHKRG